MDNNRCKICNKKLKWGKLFCSPHCRNIFRTKENSPTWKGGKPKCIDCGRQLARYGAKRCRSCSAMGQMNQNWLGGITKLAISIRNCQKYKKWRLDVYRAGKFQCSVCGSKNGHGKTIILNADHYPKKFSTIISENKISNLKEALECKELWSVENGRVLCFECHSLIDDFPITFKHGQN